MKKILVAMVAAGVVALAGASLAHAQDVSIFRAPFPFIVNGKVLPAGSYRVTRQGSMGTLLVESMSGGLSSAFVATEAVANPDPENGDVHVLFRNYDGQYFLWEVALPFQDARRVVLNQGYAEKMLVKLNLMPAEHADAGSER